MSYVGFRISTVSMPRAQCFIGYIRGFYVRCTVQLESQISQGGFIKFGLSLG